MNLQEDINRIKQVMGINENRNHFFIRRQDEFLEYILDSFDWMDVSDSDSFEEYIEDLLMRAIDDLFHHNDILVTSEEIDKLLPLAFLVLNNNDRLFNKIKKNYYANNSDTRIDEANELLTLKRREEALVKHIINSYDWLSPRRFKDFDDFLDRVVFSATRDFIADEIEGEYENKWRFRDKFGPIILDYIKKNQGLYDEIYDHYISNIY
jgi:hypothetical protein